MRPSAKQLLPVLGASTLLLYLAGPSPAGPDDEPPAPRVKWQTVPVEDDDHRSERRVRSMKRARVPGGWLVLVGAKTGGGLTFYPDPAHGWGRRPARPADRPAPKPITAPLPKKKPLDYYRGGLAARALPKAEQVPGIPWLRRAPGVSYARLRQVPELLHSKYQVFSDASRLLAQCGGRALVGRGFQIQWLDRNSYLAAGLGLRAGDVVVSVNGHSVLGGSARALHTKLKGARRFAVLVERKGKQVVLAFEVPRWLPPEKPR